MKELTTIIDKDYVALINDIKKKIKTAQLKAHRAVNTELIRMYWSIGKDLLAWQKVEKWGAKYLEQVSKDLKVEFGVLIKGKVFLPVQYKVALELVAQELHEYSAS